jgi:hypothetical protein
MVEPEPSRDAAPAPMAPPLNIMFVAKIHGSNCIYLYRLVV